MLEGNLQRQTQKHWAAEGVSVFDVFGEKQAADKPALIGSYGEKKHPGGHFHNVHFQRETKVKYKKRKIPTVTI